MPFVNRNIIVARDLAYGSYYNAKYGSKLYSHYDNFVLNFGHFQYLNTIPFARFQHMLVVLSTPQNASSTFGHMKSNMLYKSCFESSWMKPWQMYVSILYVSVMYVSE